MTSARRRRLDTVVIAVAAALTAVVAALVPSADGAYVAKVTNADTAGSATYFTCTAAAVGETGTRATFAYPFGDTALLTSATDVSGNNNPGTYSLLGITYGVANGGNCPRDNGTVITLNGSTGSVSGPTATTANPTVFSVETWFRTTVAGGKLIGFGSARTGSSTNNDRHVYLNTSGQLVFGVSPAGVVQVVTSPLTYTDGRWHHVVATLSAAGMALYADGALVASNSAVTTAQNYTGYWRIGYDNLANWPGAGNAYFTGSLAFAAAYPLALSATQVAAHYRAGTA